MGAFTGGFTSMLTGGDFVEGFATGLTVSALNHALHRAASGIEARRNIKKRLKDGGIDPNSSPGETVEEISASANKLLTEVDVFDPIRQSLSGADISYEFGVDIEYIGPNGTKAKGAMGLTEFNADGTYTVSISKNSMTKMWKFAFTLGKELFMVGKVNNGTYAGWLKNHSREWSSYNLEVKSYENWVLPLAPNKIGKHYATYSYWKSIRNKYK